jgi:hypothetical protein
MSQVVFVIRDKARAAREYRSRGVGVFGSYRNLCLCDPLVVETCAYMIPYLFVYYETICHYIRS